MSELAVLEDMGEPVFMREGYFFIGEDEKWHIKDDAPGWAKREFEDFFAVVNSVLGKNEAVVQM